eukprot:CAMPEP_0197682186 /NCGR_PEP_ID=MMETSP1338-20131121/96105_1 /TAXON_ID=43686 ORGANISM="Pelagodinium beii, Strain RCC1491" /NCGR_SAMPLE_ID=MMETSP1338 /ASSEMBLY_ACC=CAM_ASM_000754 /LENGTH=47 /DNA_ID= /DNA_START= /DNA_END= /DNA_ORIENTATION=
MSLAAKALFPPGAGQHRFGQVRRKGFGRLVAELGNLATEGRINEAIE